MMNSVQHRQSWRLNIQAKAKNIDFKLSATSLFRHCNCTFFQFSLKLKLFTVFLLSLRSEPQISSPKNPRSAKSRLRRFLEKLRIRRRPKCAQRELFSGSSAAGLGGIVGGLSRSDQISSPTNPRSSKSRLRKFLEKLRIRRRPKCTQRELFSGSSAAGLGGIVGGLSRSVFKKGKDGVFILLFCVTWLFKNFLRRNSWVFIILLTAAVVGFSGIMDFWNHFNENYVTIKHIWKVKKLLF